MENQTPEVKAEEMKTEEVAAPAPHSVKELKEALSLVCSLVQVGLDASKDGKIGLDDLGLVLKIVPKVGSALDGITQIPAELADLSDEEAGELVAHVMAELVIEDAKAKIVVGKSLKVLASVFELVMALRS